MVKKDNKEEDEELGKPDIPLPNWLDPKKRAELELNKKELEEYY